MRSIHHSFPAYVPAFQTRNHASRKRLVHFQNGRSIFYGSVEDVGHRRDDDFVRVVEHLRTGLIQTSSRVDVVRAERVDVVAVRDFHANVQDAP